jgi:hypothetical protein
MDIGIIFDEAIFLLSKIKMDYLCKLLLLLMKLNRK